MEDREFELDGTMRGLKLSDAEKSGIKFKNKTQRKFDSAQWHAIGKVFTSKYVHPEAIMPLGHIWCPSKGIACKEMGGNIFLIHFNEITGKKRALEEGPWSVGHSHDVFVLTEFEEHKLIEEVDFNYIPIWVRATKVPLGMIDRDTGIEIGDKKCVVAFFIF